MASPKTLSISVNFVTQFDSTKPFGVVCHDAGGANQIIAMLQYYGWRPAWAFVSGPAHSLWCRAFPDIAPAPMTEWIKHASAIISGTSCANDCEHLARGEAKKWNCLSITVLDHWTNYQERFTVGTQEVLPDEIWVVDGFAEQMALELFGGITVVRQPSCYQIVEAAQIAPLCQGTPNVLLYLLEPARSNWGRDEPGEYQALRYFLQCLPTTSVPMRTEIRLRPHPSEKPDKYDAFCNGDTNFPVVRASGSLSEELSQSRWVAGCQTYAMTIALAAGRTVFGTLPPWAPLCVLPHEGIIHLRYASSA